MAITQITTSFAGQDGVEPQITRIVTTDSLATITTAGYLDNVMKQGYIINAGDVLLINYNNGTLGFFTISFSNGISTLAPLTSSGEVILPVVSGHFANFSGTTGTIADAGFSPSDPAKTKVIMADAAVTLNHVAQFADTAGTIKDGGVLGTAAAKAASDNTKATLASVTAATTSGNLAQFNDTAGTVGDSSIVAADVQLNTNIIAATTGNIGGAGAGPLTVSVVGLTAASVVVATLVSSANPVQVQICAAGVDGFDVTFSGDPGATAILNYVAFVAAQ
jgi:hypothetical protein